MEELMIALIIGGWIVTSIASPLLVLFIKKWLKKRKEDKPETWQVFHDDGTIFG
jgi:hypothetical protein